MNKILTFAMPLFNGVLKHIFYVAVFFGFLFLAIGYAGLFNIEDKNWKEVFKVAGTIVLSSGVFASITKSPLFLDVFKNTLTDIVYGSKHLDARNDINEIWERTSESLCKRKFNSINTKVFNTIKNHYLPFEKEFFYKRYDLDSNYEFAENEPDYLIVENEQDAEVVSDDPDGFNYPFSWSIPLPENDNGRTVYELEEIRINDEVIKDVIEKNYLKIKRTSSSLTVDFNYHVDEKSKEHKIYRREKLVYHLDSNLYTTHSASWLYKMFNVRITYPKDLNLDWVDFGVLGKWTKNVKDHNNHKILKANYTGLVFKNQGFMIIFRKL